MKKFSDLLRNSLTPKRLMIWGIVIIVVTSTLKWILIPILLRWQIGANINLGESSDVRKLWVDYPVALGFKVYVFNVTNPVEVQKGEKPALKEIGPYVYEEYKSKAELYDHEEDDTVSFNNKNTWYFNKMKSAPLTGDEILTIPHLLILGLVLEAQRQISVMLPLINKSIPSIFRQEDSVFMTASARELIFEGVNYNCSLQYYIAKVLCFVMRAKGKDLVKVGKDSFKFSFLGKKNSTLDVRQRVKRGLQNAVDIGRVVELESKPRMNVYGESTCNEFSGTDGSIFPPFLQPDEPVKIFSFDICRSLDLVYEGPTKWKGIEGNKYVLDLGDPYIDPKLRCYCATTTTCLRRGVHDLQKCKAEGCCTRFHRSHYWRKMTITTVNLNFIISSQVVLFEKIDAPLVFSLPHFFLADAEYRSGVTGLRPQKTLHETTLYLEPLTGTPLKGVLRAQFNIMIRSVKQLELTKKLPRAIVPLIWLEESAELPEDLTNILKIVMTLLKILKWFIWILMSVGAILFASGFFLTVQKLTKMAVIVLGRSSPEVSPLDLQTPPRF